MLCVPPAPRWMAVTKDPRRRTERTRPVSTINGGFFASPTVTMVLESNVGFDLGFTRLPILCELAEIWASWREIFDKISRHKVFWAGKRILGAEPASVRLFG